MQTIPVTSEWWLEFKPLVHHQDDRWELRGGSPDDHATARERCSLFQHQATFPSTPLPLATPPLQPPKALHNRILIADDDSLVRGSLAAVLESEGFVVDEAVNGIEAVAHAMRNPPDLILLDLNMPVKNGWDTFEQLTREHPLIPIIIATARPNQLFTALGAGVGALLEKPMDIPTLLGTMKRLLDESAEQRLARLAGENAEFYYKPGAVRH